MVHGDQGAAAVTYPERISNATTHPAPTRSDGFKRIKPWPNVRMAAVSGTTQTRSKSEAGLCGRGWHEASSRVHLVRVSDPPIGASVLLNVDWGGDCPYPVPLSTPAA
jgi:hypothetical protein